MSDGIDRDDIDDIIGIAAERTNKARETLSVDELREVASELDIDPNQLQPAIAELEQRRAAAVDQRERKRRRGRVILATVAASLLVFGTWALVANTRLSGLHTEVDAAASQIRNVTERQVATKRQWGEAAESPERSAELSGAENRVRIERKRYDDAVRRYNAFAAGPFVSPWVAVLGKQAKLPYSSEVMP